MSTYDDEIAVAEKAYRDGDWAAAYDAFGRAHDVGHAVRKQHLKAHRGMIRSASHAGRVDRVIKNEALLVAAFLFDRRR